MISQILAIKINKWHFDNGNSILNIYNIIFYFVYIYILKYCGYAAAMQWQKRSSVRHSRNELRSEEIPTRI